MKNFLIHLKKLDWGIIFFACLLVGIGLVSLFSSSLSGGDFLNFKKQIIFFGIGFSLMILLSFFDWRILRNDPFLIFLLYSFSLLVLAGLFFFAPEIRGTKSWYKVGPLNFDPIEFNKIILLILLAKYFSQKHVEMYRIKHIILSGSYIFFPAILIFFQPNFGSALILVLLWTMILIISGIKIRHFFILVIIGLIFFIFAWAFLLKDYQKERVLSFIAPQTEPLGAGWSQEQSAIAIGSGSFFGKGIGKGSQAQYGFLTFPQTDFIFAAIAEEAGLLGVAILFVLFSLLIWRILKIALLAESNFPRLFAVGLVTVFISQAFVHIGMNLGLLPIIGISFPLVSYGGSSMIADFISIGILQSIKVNS